MNSGTYADTEYSDGDRTREGEGFLYVSVSDGGGRADSGQHVFCFMSAAVRCVRAIFRIGTRGRGTKKKNGI